MAELCKVNVFFRLLLFFVVFWLCWKEDACFIHGRLMKAVMPGGRICFESLGKKIAMDSLFSVSATPSLCGPVL